MTSKTMSCLMVMLLTILPLRAELSSAHTGKSAENDSKTLSSFAADHPEQTAALAVTLPDYAPNTDSKEKFWRMNMWIAFSATLIAVSGAAYYDYLGSAYVDDFHKAESLNDELQAFTNSEKAYDNRDMFLYIAVAPAFYTIFSRVKQASRKRSTR